MQLSPKNAGIRTKLITIFIAIKVLPLIALAWVAWQGIQFLGTNISSNLSQMTTQMQTTVSSVGQLALDESEQALDQQAQEAIERQTTATASAVADFLYSIDQDIAHVALLEPNQTVYRNFLSTKKRDLPQHAPWKINSMGTAWEPTELTTDTNSSVTAKNKNNTKQFHYRPPRSAGRYRSRPLFLEISFIDLEGNEKVKITTSDLVSTELKNISDQKNTWISSEHYFSKLASLKNNDIYVSKVIGAYVKSPIIGPFTPEQAAKRNIPFKPEEAAYAGKENPLGKHFQGLIRWLKPVVRNGERIGYVSLALDHNHLMAFTDHLVPTSERFSEISDANSGNYAFMWDYKGRNISHPRDYFIVGYDPKTGNQIPSWLDKNTHEKWLASGESFANYMKNAPIFSNQSLSIKPSLKQIKQGQLALDCRYLNFAPQCSGWMDLTRHGGSGSFVIFWSGLWKLTTAAAIPYFTGQYGETARGFGFVTIGANIDEFHLPATKTKIKIDEVLLTENQKLANQHQDMQAAIQETLSGLLYQLSASTLLMILIVIGIGIWMASYLTKRILHLIYGLKQFKVGDFTYRFKIDSQDEMGMLAHSLNSMANTVDSAVSNLHDQMAKRHTIEQKLAQSKSDLERTVESRTLELKEANDKLIAENDVRKKAEKRLSFMARYDDLTGLANRTLFQDHLTMAIAQGHRTSTKVGLLFIDLDKFKEINDTLGHGAGDDLLIIIANTLGGSIREGDTAARLGGDEFALVVTHVVDNDQLIDMAERIRNELTQNFTVRNQSTQIGCSIGIALYPDDAERSDQLLKNADIAMYQAKQHGGNSYQFFLNEMQKTVRLNKTLEKELSYAISHSELTIHYQPKIDIKSSTIIGAEALVRWNHPTRGLLGPYEFIPIAEKYGLIQRLGEYVLNQACRQNRQWQESGYQKIQMAVNFSAIQLRMPNMLKQIVQVLHESNLEPGFFEVEVTETTIMHDQETILNLIGQLQSLGVCVSIDDFGTGYSSFGRIKEFSFDVLKIDRSFIQGIGNSSDNAIVRAMIRMGHSLDSKLIAEGVETTDQLDFLRREGCDQYQGYYYSKPVPADEFTALLANDLSPGTARQSSN